MKQRKSDELEGVARRFKDLRSFGRRSGIALFAFVARSLQQVSTLVMTFLAARFLPPADYGVYALGIVFVVMIQTLTYTGFYQFILNARQDEDAVLSTCFWLIFGLVTLASLLLGAAAFPIEWLFGARHLGTVIVLLALIQPLASVGAWSSAALLRRRAVTLNFTIIFLQNIIALVGGGLLIWFWHSLYALVAVRYLRVISGAVLFASLGRDRPRMRFSRKLAIEATGFSGGLYFSRLLGFLSRYAGDLLLGLFHSPGAVGLYRFGNRVATGATDILMQPMNNFAATQFGAAGRDDRDLGAVLARFAGTIALLGGMAGAVVIVLAPDVISTFFQPSYEGALVVTAAMALRGVAGVGQSLVEPVFAALGRTSWVVMFNLVAGATCVAAIAVSAPFGLGVLAWGQAIAILVMTALAFHLMRRRGGISTGAAVRRFLGACALALAYGLVLAAIRFRFLPAMAISPLQTLLVSLACAALVGAVILLVAMRLRIFSLHAFSG
ncbi:oligosaccharide flippase family protein [Novosphingobium pentaromativorans]|uniref:oligosaccharide flippase family protein n=1 Tax=Novosphingobium pentaromativorans TaxID=205844 RepID=UPI00030B79DD|nr:oligosaccharide flippase family protein [Novosphingobium pentaromativorans]